MLVLEHAEKGSLDKSWGTDTGLAAGLKKALAADAACDVQRNHCRHCARDGGQGNSIHEAGEKIAPVHDNKSVIHACSVCHGRPPPSILTPTNESTRRRSQNFRRTA